jgi:glycosyltransferase involved in cell wall biosynthesis
VNQVHRLAILYRITEGPWGGGNSFLRALRNAWLAQGFDVSDRLRSGLQGVLINSSYLGPGQRLSARLAERMVTRGYASHWASWLGFCRWRGCRPPFVHRLDGVFKLYGRRADDPADEAQFGINRHMDWTIFQSEYCRRSFASEGLDVSRSTVVWNGVDLSHFSPASCPPQDGTLKLIAVAWSANMRKGFPTTVEASKLPGVEVTFVGNWPAGLDPGAVSVVPPQVHAHLPDLLRQHHAMLHMAENDPCSNAVLEAMACGLPVIYHPSGGTPEIVGSCGVPGTPDLPAAVQELRDRYPELRRFVLERRSNLSIERAARAYLDVFEPLGMVKVQ